MMDSSTAVTDQRQAFYDALKPHNLAPLWTVLHGLITPQPTTPAVSALWRYGDVRPKLMEAGGLITAEEAERRVLILENPGMPGQASITHTLYAGLQLILPGEVAPCHRHAQAALRFIVEGKGAFTAVGGEKAYMNPGDLILTPSMQWHDHGNETDKPMVWLDGLDIPLVRALDASFAEKFDQPAHPETTPPGDSLARYGRNLRPLGRAAIRKDVSTPLFSYPYSDWREALETMRRYEHWDEWDGLKLEFRNPVDGGAVMPTISAFVQLMPLGFRGRPNRTTDGAIYMVVEGEGRLTVGDHAFELAPRDVVVVPSWNAYAFEATSDLVLFSFSDRVVQQKLGLWREEPQ